MQKNSRKLYKILPLSFMMALILWLSVPSFASTTAGQWRGYDRNRSAVRVVTTQDGRRITYRRINGQWVAVRVVRTSNRYWNRHHRRMGDLRYRPGYRRP